jgi:putative solute:sodium symporter small subunit
MIEIAFGILVILGAVAILMGAGDTLHLPVGDLYPLLGATGTGIIAGAGMLLVLHGAYRLARKRKTGSRHALRVMGLAYVMLLLIALFGAVIPLLLVEPLNVVTIGGFPAGFYMAAQGSLIALVVLAFSTVAKQDAIDAEEGAADDESPERVLER